MKQYLTIAGANGSRVTKLRNKKRFTPMLKKMLFPLVVTAFTTSAFAADDIASDPRGLIEEMMVTGGADAIYSLSGSATFIDEEQIAKFEITDINALLRDVPGVYIRQEDGFGLRPNIGLRGTSSERSSKITMMEDGILIGPAPYSAPAAYYVPNISRMSAVEVFKGPAAIEYGPHTVGGAVNFVTRAVPESEGGELNAALGSFGFEKYRAFYGNSFEQWGFTIDALHFGSDGFKELDTGGDTGFDRNDLNAKLRWHSGASARVYQELEIKLGYADESSNETYLGLTESDFLENPLRRYAASRLDKFTSEHTQLQLLHSAEFSDSLKIISRAYYHSYERAWNKFDGFINGVELRTVLASPDIFASQMQILQGEADSNRNSNQRLDLTNNDRSYEVNGVQVEAKYELLTGALQHTLNAGIRLHNDWVERHHSQRGYFMTAGELVFDDDETRLPKALNRGEASALALFVRDEMAWGNWLLNAGLRHETIESDFVEEAGAGANFSHTQEVLMPGAGAFYHFNDSFGFLFGVNKGFSAKAASAAPEVEPEESVNYEYGLRYRNKETRIEAIGFYSDYKNLLGRCRISDPCSGEEFNGGEVDVFGLEFNASTYLQLSPSLSMPISAVYTFTDATFATGFESGFDIWGDVEKGDQLPYLPEHQGRIQFGLNSGRINSSVAINYIGEMREIAGSGDYEEAAHTEALTTFDISVSYQLLNDLTLRLVGENITDQLEVVSRRPYGARPNAPRIIKASVNWLF